MKSSVNITSSKQNETGLYKYSSSCNGLNTWFILLAIVTNGKISGMIVNSSPDNKIGGYVNNWDVDMFVRLPAGSTVTLEQQWKH